MSLSLSFSNASLYALSYYGTKDNQKYGDIYFPADLTVKVGEVTSSLDEVGVRMKGNTSRDEFVSKEGTISQASHFKISFKATFDDDIYSTSEFSAFKHDWSNDASGRKARKKRRLYTMSKLDLKYLPRNDGATYSEEIFAYNSFLSEGIPAPYARWGKVHLSSESDSKDYSYELIETVDDDFIMRRFDNDNQGGDLYKCVWGSYNGNWTGANLSRSDAVSKVKDENNKSIGTRISNGRIGVEDNWNGYHPNYQLKTNDDGENSDFSKMANFINVIYDCRYGARDFAELNSVLDLDEFLRFEAMSYLLGNFDDQRNNANNYYLYFLPTTGKAIYIPYDWDWALNTSKGAEKYTMYETTGINGENISTNVYFATIFDNSDISYSLSRTKGIYEGYISTFFEGGYLEESNYDAFVNSLSDHLDVSCDDVSSYFAAKKSLVSGELQKLGL